MFGFLVNSDYISKNHIDLSENYDTILSEAERLLLGPWNNGGNTTFEFSQSKDKRALNYDTGKWEKKKGGVKTILITHTTEYSNKVRKARLACEYDMLNEDKDGYEISFRLLRN